MKVRDPGHDYRLAHLDGVLTTALTFVKRVGDKFPGNKPPAHEGVTTQEVLRALIDRQAYVQGQEFHIENIHAVRRLREALWWLELRAVRMRGRDAETALDREISKTMPSLDGIENLPVCPTCGHIACLVHK